MRRLAVLSMHTSPLVQPGSGDGGGMNVYVRELASALSQAGGRSTVFTRRVDPDTPTVVEVEPGFRVVHVDAGAQDLPKVAILLSFFYIIYNSYQTFLLKIIFQNYSLTKFIKSYML